MDRLEPKAPDGPAQAIHGAKNQHSTEPAVAGDNAALALALLRALPDSACLVSADGRVTFVNRAGAERLKAQGQPASIPTRGRLLWEIWPDADEAALRQALGQVFQGDAVELTLDCPGLDRGLEGATVPCNVSLVPIEDLRGGIQKALCIAREEPSFGRFPAALRLTPQP